VIAPIELFINEDNARNECNSCKTHHIVIPAKAGIQLVEQSPRITSDLAGVFCSLVEWLEVPSADKAKFEELSHFVGDFVNRLDSRFRGNDGCCMASFINYVKLNKLKVCSKLNISVCSESTFHRAR